MARDKVKTDENATVKMMSANGQEFEIPDPTGKHKKAIDKAIEEAEESRLAEFLTSAYDKTMAAVREVYKGLTDDEQLALNQKTVVVRYNAMRIKEAGSHQTNMVMVRQRAVRGSKSNGQSK